MAVIDELLEANRRYSGERPQVQLPMPPSRRVAVLACMDARLDPARILGLGEGEAHVIRNAGGRAADAIRSLVISQRLLGTTAIAVIHHTDCGMLTFDNTTIRARIRQELSTDPGSIDFLPFDDIETSVRDDLATLRASPLIAPGTDIRGFVYDVKTGGLAEVSTGQPSDSVSASQ
jgi:carbonic anhydrase